MQNSLVLHSSHNGINCISNPEATRPCDKVWFTAKQIEDALCVNKRTLNRHIETLENIGDLCIGTNLSHCKIPTNNGGSKETTIYNLDAFNKICMTFIDNEVCQQVRQKFSDILSEVETTGSYGIQQISRKDQLYLAVIHADSPRVRMEALDELTKIEEDEKKAIEAERDDAIRTKAWISDKKTATAVGRSGGLVKENNALKKRLAIAGNYRTIQAVASKNHISWKAISWCKLKRYCETHGLDVEPVPDERYETVNAYPIEAFRAVYPELKI